LNKFSIEDILNTKALSWILKGEKILSREQLHALIKTEKEANILFVNEYYVKGTPFLDLNFSFGAIYGISISQINYFDKGLSIGGSSRDSIISSLFLLKSVKIVSLDGNNFYLIGSYEGIQKLKFSDEQFKLFTSALKNSEVPRRMTLFEKTLSLGLG